jgi:microcystin-dependent protein
MSATKIQSNFITDGSVTTAKIADGTVTAAKLSPLINFFPAGGIIMWSGSVASIPSGWVLCDGSNSTPDLRNRFIVGASVATGDYAWNATTGAVTGNYAPGNTGGEAAHKLTVAELAAHTHTGSAQYPGSGPEQNQAGSPEDNTTFNINSGSTGGDQYHENRPPYYALAFIMKT